MFGNILCNFLLRYRNNLPYQNATDYGTFYIAENKRKLFWLRRKLTLICIFILIFQKILKFHMILYMILWFLKAHNYLICSNMKRYFAWFKIYYLAKYVYTIQKYYSEKDSVLLSYPLLCLARMSSALILLINGTTYRVPFLLLQY